MTESQWLTTNEAAEMIGRSPASVRRLCEDAVWPDAYRASAGAHWRIPRSNVVAWLKSIRPVVRQRLMPEAPGEPSHDPSSTG